MANYSAVVSILALLSGYAAYRWAVHDAKGSHGFIREVGESDIELDPRLLENVHADPRNAQDNPAANGEADHDIGRDFDMDDRARRALEERQQQQMENMAAGEQRVNAWKQRGAVGTKKAKSLARREQRRAYFEFVRQQAEKERERIRLEEQMFGDLMAEEREERALRIAEAKAALDKANAARRAEEEAEREKTAKRRLTLLSELDPQNGGKTRLQSEDDVDICENLSDVIVLDNEEYAVKVTQQSIDAVVEALGKGKLDVEQLQSILQGAY